MGENKLIWWLWYDYIKPFQSDIVALMNLRLIILIEKICHALLRTILGRLK